jgi:hypothetical protein
MLKYLLVMAQQKQGLQYGTYYSNNSNGGGSKMARMLIIGVIAVAIIGTALFALSLLNGNSRNDLTLLAVRENSLLTLANASQKEIRYPDLSTANSNATVLLTSDVATVVADTGIKKLPDDLVKKEADTNTEALKQASLLNKFDLTYRQIVMSKVAALLTQAEALQPSVSNKKSREVLDKIIVNLKSIEKQFTELSL